MRVSMGLSIGMLALAAGCGTTSPPHEPSSSAAATTTKTTAAPVPPQPKIGALFLGAGDMHTCTAAVLDSTAGDLILTAAHCVATNVDTTFVAAFKDTADPARVWKVDAIYLDPRWVKNRDPLADFAILRVVRDGGGSVEADAGGGFALGPAPKPGTVVSVIGYELGVGGGPVGCDAATELTPEGFPSLLCVGLVGGTSGAPWTVGPAVIGLVGGLNGGGCDENATYSPPFDGSVVALLTRAEAGGPADPAPADFTDDCPTSGTG
jgi:hypothetical protein